MKEKKVIESMIDPANIKSVYFIGIGGIGMSALARYFNKKGCIVAGYDKTETDLTKKLVSEGIDIHYQDRIEQIPFDPDLIVYTPAVPKYHSELNHFRTIGKPVIKRAELLGLISKMSRTIAVAGTHGKTTTSCMIAHLLRHGGRDISAFLGGIMTGYETNYFLGQESWVVVEADEYDRSFMHLQPTITVLNSMDADHLDIYGDDAHIKEGFKLFLSNTITDGTIYISESVGEDLNSEELTELAKKYEVITFGLEKQNEARAERIRVDQSRIVFDYTFGDLTISNLKLRMPGVHNVRNACAAISAAIKAGLDHNLIAEGIANFEGIKRRFEYIVDADVVYIDDYAHHPTELEAAISAARLMYPNKSICGIFQPHLYSRTKDFVDGFAKALDQLDEIILMDIYPAREEPIEGVTSELIMDKMNNTNRQLLGEAELLNHIKKSKHDVYLTLGAGDIDLLIPKIKDIIKCK